MQLFADPLQILAGVMAFVATVWGLLRLYATKSQPSADLLHKMAIFIAAAKFFVFSSERKYAKPGTPGNPDAEEVAKTTPSKTVHIIFIRHGESDWNEVFNRGFGPSFPIRLIKALFNEFRLLTKIDSVFVDSSLSKEGYDQAVKLRAEISKYETKDEIEGKLISALKGDGQESAIVVSSNLRRAIQTIVVGLNERLTRSSERVHILPFLQEVSRNFDTFSITNPLTPPQLGVPSRYISKALAEPEELFDVSGYKGTKATDKAMSNGLKRMHLFAEWALGRKESVIIVGGHSLWFRLFFATFLPVKTDHPCTKKKMVNGGAVAFKLCKADLNGPRYFIQKDSIRILYGGFMK